MKVLLVDDSRAMRAILGSIVRKMGFEVSEAEHGLDALEKLSQCSLPDLLLVDWNMPEMNGLELVKELRSKDEYQGLRIVMVTSESEMDCMVAALEAGADEYLMKPFEPEELIAKLKQIGLAI